MITRASLQAAFDLLEFLQGRGIKCVIAGGCARDIFFGVKPKDVDIIVVDESMATLEHDLIDSGLAYTSCHFYQDAESSDRIMGCFKLAGLDIDVVLYDCLEVDEAIEAFDFNLNQFVISGVQHGIDGATSRFLGETHWSRMAPVRMDFTEARHHKMLMKYLDLVPRLAAESPNDLPSEVPVGGAHGIY